MKLVTRSAAGELFYLYEDDPFQNVVVINDLNLNIEQYCGFKLLECLYERYIHFVV